MKIKSHLAAIMAENQITTTELSKELGISRNTITSLKKGNTTMIKFEVIELLCNYFTISIDQLLNSDYTPF